MFTTIAANVIVIALIIGGTIWLIGKAHATLTRVAPSLAPGARVAADASRGVFRLARSAHRALADRREWKALLAEERAAAEAEAEALYADVW